MSALIPFAFDEHLVRATVRDDEPWFCGKDVCDALAIVKHHQALESLDSDERGTCTVGTPGGEQSVIVISEPGVFRLVFRSRKPEAERFKRWLAHEVLPALRRNGRYEAEAEAASLPAAAGSLAPPNILHEPLRVRIEVQRAALATFGQAIGRIMWNRLGLPAVPPPPPTVIDEAHACMRHLLDAMVHEGGPTIRNTLERALDDDEQARVDLVAAGIRPLSERDAFVVCNQAPRLDEIFKGTEFSWGRHRRVLGRLPGIEVSGPLRVGGTMRRGLVVPAHYLDEGIV